MENDNNIKLPNKAPAIKAAGQKIVKRIKIPTVRQAGPAPQPAPQTAAAPETAPQPAHQPASQETAAAQVQNNMPAQPATTPQPAGQKEAVPETTAVLKPKRAASSSGKAPAELQPDPEKEAEKEKKKAQIRRIFLSIKWALANRWIRLGIEVVLVCIIFGGIFSSLPTIAEKRLPALLAANGIPFRSFKLKEMTINTMELTGVSDKTGTMSVSSLKINYSLTDLYFNNNIRSITLSGVTLTGERREDGISLGALGNLISSPMNPLKGKELSISSLRIQNGNFILKDLTPPEKITNEDGEEEEVDKTISVQFSANGSLDRSGLNMSISTQYASPHLSLKTETSLNKTSNSSRIKTEITEGNLLKKKEKVGSATGNLEIAVSGGVLSTGTADLLISSSSQKLKLNTSITPKEAGFDIALDLDRSFDDPKDAAGKFVGTMSVKANNVTVGGTFQSFKGTLPLQLKAEIYI